MTTMIRHGPSLSWRGGPRRRAGSVGGLLSGGGVGGHNHHNNDDDVVGQPPPSSSPRHRDRADDRDYYSCELFRPSSRLWSCLSLFLLLLLLDVTGGRQHRVEPHFISSMMICWTQGNTNKKYITGGTNQGTLVDTYIPVLPTRRTLMPTPWWWRCDTWTEDPLFHLHHHHSQGDSQPPRPHTPTNGTVIQSDNQTEASA
jgi:hypothetical protein